MWAIQPIPAPGGVASRVSAALAAVSCPAAGDCFAVGSLPATGGTTVLVDELRGMRWERHPVPSPGGTAGGDYSALTGISCTSSSACAAVGTFTNGSAGQAGFAETWNGSRWSVQRTPAPAGSAGSVQLSGVSCATATLCVAVGSVTVDTTTTPIAEVYDGRTWTATGLAVPSGATGGELSSVSCTIAGACQAVGGHQGAGGGEDPLVEAFDGSTWREAALAIPAGAVAFERYGGLDGISCPGATACVAVGSYSTTTQPEVPYAEVMSGTAWTLAPVPFDTAATAPSTGLSAVSCTSASACTAAGIVGRQLLIEHWDGTGWTGQPTAAAPRGTYVDDAGGVACVGSDCVAVGSDAPGRLHRGGGREARQRVGHAAARRALGRTELADPDGAGPRSAHRGRARCRLLPQQRLVHGGRSRRARADVERPALVAAVAAGSSGSDARVQRRLLL